MKELRRFETRAVHSGERRGGRDENGGFSPISTPIYASTTFSHRDIETTDRFVGAYDLGAVEKRVAELRPRAVVIETISNPLLRVADTAGVAEVTRAGG